MPVRRILNKLCSNLRSTNAARPNRRAKPTRVRLSPETLDDRIVPSASSFNLHSVQQPDGNSAAFFRNPANDVFTEKTPQAQIVQLAAAHEVTDFSAGLDPNGHADVFAHKDGVMQEFDAGSWQNLNQPRPMLSFAAVNGGRMYAVANDNSLWEFAQAHNVTYTVYLMGQPRTFTVLVPAQWTELWGANAVWALDAVTQTSNSFDMVFAIGGDGRLEKYVPSSNTWYLLAAGNTFSSFSAGLDTDGYADVFMVSNSGYLERWTTLSGVFATVDHFDNPLDVNISASSSGGVFCMFSGNFDGTIRIAEYDRQNHLISFVLPPHDNITAMSVDGPNDVYVITSDGSLQEHPTSGPNDVWVIWT